MGDGHQERYMGGEAILWICMTTMRKRDTRHEADGSKYPAPLPSVS